MNHIGPIQRAPDPFEDWLSWPFRLVGGWIEKSAVKKELRVLEEKGYLSHYTERWPKPYGLLRDEYYWHTHKGPFTFDLHYLRDKNHKDLLSVQELYDEASNTLLRTDMWERPPKGHEIWLLAPRLCGTIYPRRLVTYLGMMRENLREGYGRGRPH